MSIDINDTQQLMTYLVSSGYVKLIAAIFIFISAVQCYAGYKSLRAMIGVYSIILGFIGFLIVGYVSKEMWAGIAVGVVIAGSAVFLTYKFYRAGIFMFVFMTVTDFVYFIMLSLYLKGLVPLIIAAVVGIAVGVTAVFIIRPTVIISSALSGALTIMVSTCALMSLTPDTYWKTSVALMAILSATGIACQFNTSSKHSLNMLSILQSRNRKKEVFSFSERKYPGMQRAYRNFCIQCGRELVNGEEKCPGCGFRIND